MYYRIKKSVWDAFLNNTINLFSSNLKFPTEFISKVENYIMPNTTALSNFANIWIGASSVSFSTYYNSEVSFVRSHFFEDVNIQAIDLPNCLSLGFRCFGIQNIPFISLPKLQSMEKGAFMYFRGESINLPLLGEIPENGFGRSNLVNADFPKCKNVRSYAFLSCSALQHINLPECLLIYSHAFEYCTSLQSISLPECLDFGQSTFTGCTSLSQVYAPNCIQIEGCAFYSCDLLQSVTFDNCARIGVSAFFQCFRNESAKATLSFPECSIVLKDAFIFAGLSQPEPNIEFMNFEKCLIVGSGAFGHCAVKRINLPICQTIYENAFHYACLSAIDLPACSYISGYAFAFNYNLSSVSIPKCHTLGEGAFASCSNLTSIVLPKECSVICQRVFEDCVRLKSITILYSRITIDDYPSGRWNPFRNTLLTQSQTTINGSIVNEWPVYIYVPSSCLDYYRNSVFYSLSQFVHGI